MKTRLFRHFTTYEKIGKRSLAIVCLSLLFPSLGHTQAIQDTVKSKAYIEHHTPSLSRKTDALQETGMSQLHESNLSQVILSYQMENNRNRPTSLGNGYHDFSIGALSYIRLDQLRHKKSKLKESAESVSPQDTDTPIDSSKKKYQDAFWGHASYSTGKKLSVIGNETSNYEMLFPYIMSDTVGGDLPYEKYRFGGGYARGNENIRWGLSGSYTATLEYRKIDPRPGNTVSDLDLGGSVSWRTGKEYFTGIGIHAGLYNQKNQVAFYNPLGGCPEWNMTGLFAYHQRFSRDKTDVSYIGSRYGASISVLPSENTGWHSVLKYTYQHLTRISNTAQTNGLDLNTLDYHIVEWRTVYSQAARSGKARQQTALKQDAESNSNLEWEAALDLDYELRSGQDIIYGSAQNNIYPELTRERNMFLQNAMAQATGLTRLKRGGEVLTMRTYLNYQFLRYRRYNPDESLDGQYLGLGMEALNQWNSGKNNWMLGGSAEYRQAFGAFNSYAQAQMQASYTRHLGKIALSISLSAHYRYYLTNHWREMLPWSEYAQRSGSNGSGSSPHSGYMQVSARLMF